jgi:hypothetical protein
MSSDYVYGLELGSGGGSMAEWLADRVTPARLLLEHLPDRAAILPRMAAALRPGGVLVVEDHDWTGFGFSSTTWTSRP